MYRVTYRDTKGIDRYTIYYPFLIAFLECIKILFIWGWRSQATIESSKEK